MRSDLTEDSGGVSEAAFEDAVTAGPYEPTIIADLCADVLQDNADVAPGGSVATVTVPASAMSPSGNMDVNAGSLPATAGTVEVHATSAPAVLMGEETTRWTASVNETSRILLVEDNVIFALDAEDMLHGLRTCEVLVCDSIEEALATLADGHVDFAFLSVMVGETATTEVAERLTAAGTPFVWGDDQYEQTAALARMFPETAVLEKPYKLEALRQVLPDWA